MTYLTGKPGGDSSMSLKRVLSEDVVGQVPQDPCDMVKARLLESQFSDGEGLHSSVERLQSDATLCISLISRLMQLPTCGAIDSESI
jgi:hypothetical protein